jgi:Ca2+-binding EF-hand superfamily protein
MFTPSELETHQAINSVFKKFDADHSNTLEMSELLTMFKKYNIDITLKDLKALFTIVDEDKSGALDLSEFKKFTLSEKVKHKFRKIITDLRE